MLLIKLLIVVLLLAVIASLFSGLFFLVKDDASLKRTVKALTWRVSLSVVAIVVIVIAAMAGFIPVKTTPF